MPMRPWRVVSWLWVGASLLQSLIGSVSAYYVSGKYPPAHKRHGCILVAALKATPVPPSMVRCGGRKKEDFSGSFIDGSPVVVGFY